MKINEMWSWLSGKKTYIVTAATCLYAITGWALGYVEQQMAIEMLSTALTGAAIRNGITLPQK